MNREHHAAFCITAAVGLASTWRCVTNWRRQRETIRRTRLEAFERRFDEWVAQEYRDGEGDVDQNRAEDMLRKAVEYGAPPATRAKLAAVVMGAVADDVKAISCAPPHDSHALQLIETVSLRLSRVTCLLRMSEGPLLAAGGLAPAEYRAFVVWKRNARWEGWCALWYLVAKYHLSWGQLTGILVAVACGGVRPRAISADASLAAFVAGCSTDVHALEVHAFVRVLTVATVCEAAASLLQQWHRSLSQRSDEAPLRNIKRTCVENIARADLSFLTTVVPFDLLTSLERDQRVFRQLVPQAHTVLLLLSQFLTSIRLVTLPATDAAVVAASAVAFHIFTRCLRAAEDCLIVDCEDEDLTHISGKAAASGQHDLWDILGDDFVTYRLFGREVDAALQCVEGDFKHADILYTNKGITGALVHQDGTLAVAVRRMCQYAPLLLAATTPQILPRVLQSVCVTHIPETFTLFLELAVNFGSLAGALQFFSNAWLPALRVMSLLDLPRKIDHGDKGSTAYPEGAAHDIELRDVWFRFAKRCAEDAPAKPAAGGGHGRLLAVCEDSNTESASNGSPDGLRPVDAPGALPRHRESRRRPWVLRGLSLAARAGEHIGIVGPSGCGKSTLLLLLSRLYDPVDGTVSLGGRSLDEFNVGWLRRTVVASAGQEHADLFNDTVFANLRLGKPDATEEEAVEALRNAAADDFMTRTLLYTRIGWQGTELSSGQEARVCLARALLAQPDILLLDEISAHLDAATEDTLRQRLAALSEARRMTIINVSHRLSFVRDCDSIIVMNQQGGVAACGTHQKLQQTCQWYADACRKQSISPDPYLLSPTASYWSEAGSPRHALVQAAGAREAANAGA